MSFITFLIIGLLAGIIAKAVMPGSADKPSGWIMTIVLGVAGAFVGGYIGLAFGIGGGLITEIILAAVGAIVIIALMRLFSGRRIAR